MNTKLLFQYLVYAAFAFAIIPTKTFAQSKVKVKTIERTAHELFRAEEYREALPFYLKLDSLKPNNSHVWARTGICYLHTDEKLKALSYLEKAKEMGDHKDHIDFYLGEAYHLHHEFDKAIQYFESSRKHHKSLKNQDHAVLGRIDRYIEMCDNGKELIKNPVEVKIENLGKNVNSKYPEYAPVISADETVLIFTARRPNTTGGKVEENGQFYEDIYVSYKDSTGWSKPENLKNINTDGHDASIGISPDGQELLIYKHDNNGDIFYSTLKGNVWSTPQRFSDNINSKYWEPSASISADEKYLFFTSDREGGFGARDIYVVKQLPNGDWGKPKNLGPNINTAYDEDAPFIHPDGKTLYFSSKGHSSMGGFDIFTVEYDVETDSVTKPVNVGYPINTADDDIFFVWSADGTRGYFSSFRADSYGEKDIYMVSRPKQNVSLIVLKGKVYSKGVKPPEPVAATITVTDNETNKIVGVYNSNSYTGKYTVIVPPGKNYGISVEADKHLSFSENVFIPNKDEYYEVTKDVYLEPLVSGSVTVLKNVFFDFNKSELRKESFSELDRYYKLLVENPTLQIEIAGHTDDVGNDEYNQRLSEERALSVIKYFVEKGISKERLYAVGYGESFPVATNTTDEGRQMNRRTEIIIVDALRQGEKLKPKEGFYFVRDKERQKEIADSLNAARSRGVVVNRDHLRSLSNIYYGVNKHDLTDTSRVMLDQWIALLKDDKNAKILLAGYTDNTGSAAYNISLAKRRTSVVKNYMISKGVSPAAITTEVYGEDRPAGSNDTEEGRQKNRRVEIKFVN